MLGVRVVVALVGAGGAGVAPRVGGDMGVGVVAGGEVPPDAAAAAVLELAALGLAGPGADGGVPAGLGLDAGLLVHADQQCAGWKIEVEAAYLSGLGPEGGVVGAVEPAADLVRADLGLGQDAADGGGGADPAAPRPARRHPGAGPEGGAPGRGRARPRDH